MKELIIRKAVQGDLTSILEIKKESHNLYVEKRPDIYKASEVLYTENFIESFFNNNQRMVLVGLLDKEIIGYMFIEILNVQLPMMVERKYMYIHDFAISKRYRHKGTATKMLAYVEEYAKSEGILKIELAVHIFSEDAISLYENIGFKSRAIRMEKDIKK